MAKAKLIYSDWSDDMGIDEDYAKENWYANHDEGEEPTESQIWNEISFLQSVAFEDFEYELKRFMKDKKFILKGTLGLWDRDVYAGTVVKDMRELFDALDMSGDYYTKFEDVAGKLMITVSHHDGTNYFELRELTDKGLKKYESKYDQYSSNRDLVKTLMDVACYSKNANYSKIMWG